MKKQILRITESDLQSIITESVRHIIKETLSSNGEYDVLKDIMNGKVTKDKDGYACSIVPYEEDACGHIDVEGLSGNQYVITVYGGGSAKQTSKDMNRYGRIEDYIPNDSFEYKEWIEKVIIEKVTDLGQENEVIPYETNQQFEEWLFDLIKWDWDNYDFESYDDDERIYYDDEKYRI